MIAVGRFLIANCLPDSWPIVMAAIQQEQTYGQRLLQSFAYNRQSAILQGSLTADQVADLYIWLTVQFPHEQDPNWDGAVTPRHEVAHLRDQLLDMLVKLGTGEAHVAITRIVERFPKMRWLPRRRVEAKQQMLANTWTPLQPHKFVENLQETLRMSIYGRK